MKNVIIKKLAFLFIGILGVSQVAFAQLDISVGVSKSFDLSSESSQMMNSNSSFGMNEISYLGRNETQSIGVNAKKKFGFLFLSAGADYRMSNFDYSVTSYFPENPSVTSEASMSRTAVSIPVLAGLQFNNLSIGVGPIFDFVMDETISEDISSGLSVVDNNLYSAFQFAVGYELFNRVNVGARYERSLYKVKNQFELDNRATKFGQNPDLFTLTLSVNIN